MKKSLKALCWCLGLTAVASHAQSVDMSKYTDYVPLSNPDSSLLVYGSKSQSTAVDVSLRPDHVNNMESKHFPPVFNQAGGSCGSASRIGYMFTHEMNAYRATDASFMENCYPTHFVWLLTSGNSGKGEFMKDVGIPSATTYGGRTYSELFGNQSEKDEAFGWMNGYEKWYEGMFNKMMSTNFIPAHLGTVEGREAAKNWLWNHNGDLDYAVGGVGGIGVATGSNTKIPSTPANDENGLTGLPCVNHWGTQVNHALTIVGYDDRVEFDLDNDGVFGEESADERGAWIIVNSWGTKWANGGAVYCPYAYGGKRFNLLPDGSYEFDTNTWWNMEVMKVRKNYRPLRTIKVKMDYSHRSEIKLSAGISENLEASFPDQIKEFHHFRYAGDGNRGETNPAPAVPMLGRWADGKMHDEPMEFGYDLTDLTAGFDRSTPLKYFFIVETKLWAQGAGHIYDASIMDYEFDQKGVEFPFDLHGDQVKIESKGRKTIISVVVRGEGYKAPRNLRMTGDCLAWDAPIDQMYPVEGYHIYKNNELMATLSSDECQFTTTHSDQAVNYAVAAVYAGQIESAKQTLALASSTENQAIHCAKGGFIVPHAFDKKYTQATLEFWVSPDCFDGTLLDIGPGAGQFFLMIASNGALNVGWDNDKANKYVSSPLSFPVGKWTHVAVAVNGNKMSVYLNGEHKRTITSNFYQGIGGFGHLYFRNSKKLYDIPARFDEIRIWDYAKTSAEVKAEYKTTFNGDVMPRGLQVYYKGDMIEENFSAKLLESVAGLHAEVLGLKCYPETATDLVLGNSTAPLTVAIQAPVAAPHVGETVKIEAERSHAVHELSWSVPALNIQGLKVTSPSFVFNRVGNYEIIVEAKNLAGDCVADTCEVAVAAMPVAQADFTLSKNKVAMGERVSFHVSEPLAGYVYEWTLPGSDVGSVKGTHAAATYDNVGTFDVALSVVSPDGKKVSSTQQLNVELVAPVADFEISPAVLVKGNTTFLKDRSVHHPTSWTWSINSAKKNYIVNGQHSSLVMDAPGVYDVQLTASNEKGEHSMTRNAALIVCNANSETGLNFDQPSSKVILSQVPFAEQTTDFTIEWWMNPGRISSYCNGIGEAENTFMLKNDGDGIMSFYIGSTAIQGPRKMVVPYQWHHYAVTFKQGKVSFFRDGELMSSSSSNFTSLPAMNSFALGLEHASMSGMIDEFRIWGEALNVKTLQSYANAPILDVKKAEDEHQLLVYYDFNQGSGNAIDATSHQNTGVREGFGPDGDAWVLSSGVFCLNFENVAYKEVTASYLKNYRAPFAHSEDIFTNDREPNRFYAITDWKLENTVKTGNITSGVYVDAEKDNFFTCQVGWEGFAALKDHKAYQTVMLPAGSYEFVANYGKWRSPVKNTVLAAAIGVGLPNTKECASKALASTVMAARSPETLSHKINFVLKEKTQVSLGVVITMSGRLTFALSDFHLLKSEPVIIEADGADGYEMNVDASGSATLYLPYAVKIPAGVTAFVVSDIKDGKVLLQEITDGVIPARVGVVISAASGTYHFVPSSKTGVAVSLLQGTTKEMEMDPSQNYFVWNGEGETPQFVKVTGTTLAANQAFLVREQGDATEVYDVDFVISGIGDLQTEATDAEWFDVSGRRVQQLDKGIYLGKGKKIFKR